MLGRQWCEGDLLALALDPEVGQGLIADQPWIQGAEERLPALIAKAQPQPTFAVRVVLAQAFDPVGLFDQGD